VINDSWGWSQNWTDNMMAQFKKLRARRHALAAGADWSRRGKRGGE